MRKNKRLMAYAVVVLVGLMPFVSDAQIEKKMPYEVSKTRLPFGKDTFNMPFIRVLSPLGLERLATKMTDTARYPLYLLQKTDAEPFMGILQMHLERSDTMGALTQQLKGRLAVFEEKERVWVDIQTVQNERVASLQRYIKDLRDINDSMSVQFKSALSTAREANKGRLWEALKNVILGAAIGLVIGILFIKK